MPMRQSTCPICRSGRRMPLAVQHRWHDTAWRSVRCRECGHRYTDPVPADDELRAMYDDGYFDANGAWVCGFWPGSYVENEPKLRHEARDALREVGAPAPGGARLLEVGAAGGFFLDEARRAGWDVVGIELNEHMADFGRRELGLDMRAELFEHALLEPGSFDVLVAQDVLEHVREPERFVRRAAELLRPGGTFFVRGPLEQSMREELYLALRKYVRRRALVREEPPYHLQGFVRRSFEQLVRRAGLSMERFRVSATRPRWSAAGLKETTSSLLDVVAYAADVARRRGDFMLARARKPA